MRSNLLFSFPVSLIIYSFIACFTKPLPSNAATFSSSQTLLKINNFSILTQNTEAESSRNAIAFTKRKDSTADALGDGTLTFTNNKNDAVLDLNFISNASGKGSNYYSLGESSSFISSTFLVDANDILSFDFILSLALENEVDSEFDGSVTTYTEVSFSLFDDFTDAFLGEFVSVGNIDTNLTDNINNDTIFATSNLDFVIDSFIEKTLFDKEKEFANLEITGNIQQTFNTETQVRLEANTFNISCTQSIQNSDPCIKTTVPESSNVLTIIIGSLGIGLFYRKKM